MTSVLILIKKVMKFISTILVLDENWKSHWLRMIRWKSHNKIPFYLIQMAEHSNEKTKYIFGIK